MIYPAVLAAILFLASAVWMVRDFYHVVRGIGRPSVLSIVAFGIAGEAMAILWMIVWSVK